MDLLRGVSNIAGWWRVKMGVGEERGGGWERVQREGGGLVATHSGVLGTR